jgi:hypothetical protein
MPNDMLKKFAKIRVYVSEYARTSKSFHDLLEVEKRIVSIEPLYVLKTK